MLLSLIRSLAALILALAVFAGFCLWLILSQVSGKFLYPAVYADALTAADAYPRLYSDLLAGPAGEGWARDLLGEGLPVADADLIALMQDVAPPEYLQGQVEGNLHRAAAYFRAETDGPELYLELAEPLGRLTPATLNYLDRRIDRLEVVEPELLSHPFSGADYARALGESLNGLIFRQSIPETLPSIRILPEPLRPAAFDRVMSQLPDYLPLPPESRANLAAAAPELQAQFTAGHTRQFLKTAARAIAKPVLEREIAAALAESGGLDDQRRLPLLPLLAAATGYPTAGELSAELDRLRSEFNYFLNRGRLISLAVVLLGTVLLGMLYLPAWPRCLRWPGITLLLSGLAAFGLGWLAASVLPSAAAEGLRRLLESDAAVSPAAVNLLADLAQELTAGLLAGIGNGGLALALLGAVLLALAYVLERRRKRAAALGG